MKSNGVCSSLPLLAALGPLLAALEPLLGRSWPLLAALGPLLGRHAKIIKKLMPKMTDLSPQKGAKMNPKSIPKLPPDTQNDAPKRCSISGSILAWILSLCGVPKGFPKGSQNHSKSSSAPQGRPKASREPPGSLQGPPGGLQGIILASFWTPGSSFSSLSSVLFEACARPTTRSKTLFEITSQRILCDRCGTDAHNTAGSVVGLGPQAHWRSGH